MYYQVAKQVQGAKDAAPELFIVEDGELNHFLHENMRAGVVLLFTEFPDKNLYTLSNDKD